MAERPMEPTLRARLVRAAVLEGRSIHRSNLPLMYGGKLGRSVCVIDGQVFEWISGTKWIFLGEATTQDYRRHYVAQPDSAEGGADG